ncbi:phosphatase PAP2 family protein [Aliarcobacter butzleri]
MTQENINKQIIITAILLITVVLFFQFTDSDLIFQKLFYDFETKSWIIDRNDNTLKFIFYSGFKKLFIIFSIVIILLTIISFFKKFELLQKYKKGLIILSLSVILVPSLSSLKNITNVPCPVNIIEFGGNSPDVKILENYPKDYIQETKQRCWPAGHVTMGFSLMALYFLFKNPRNKKIALISAITIGILTGGYKILIGDHFLSHTLVTMILAWLIIIIIVKYTSLLEKVKFEKPTKV